MTPRYVYVFDIDGTISNLTHRLHFIKQEPKNWDEFFSACWKDSPIWPVIHVAQALAEKHRIVFITGRSETSRTHTTSWLAWYSLFGDVYMRPRGDHRPDDVVKPELLRKLQTELAEGEQILGIFEDRKSVVDAYRKMGIQVFQVDEGDF
jgi:phosphoglycolate phosphatase-like HAD superfamily hydrolase